MTEWTIRYSEIPLGVAVHGVLTIYTDTGVAYRSYEGLATDPKTGIPKPIGSAMLGDVLKAYSINGKSRNSTTDSEIVYSGSQ